MKTIIIIFSLFTFSMAKYLLLMGEQNEDCTKGGAKFIEMTSVEYEYVNDTTYYMNGVLKILKKVKSPWQMHYHIEKYDHGQWNTAMINRNIPDFCKVISDPKAPWIIFTNHLKQKECPFEAGYEQTFDMEDVPEAVLPPYVTFTMIGKYRAVTIANFIDENGKTHEECSKISFEIALI